ncbi:MAG: Gfo/Idh/MocA family protein [Blastocatellia bacterium]
MAVKQKGADSAGAVVPRDISRRRFLHQAAVTGAVTLAAPAIIHGRNLNGKLNLAIIGAGGRGGANLRELTSENIAILCDVNTTNLAKAAEKFPDARRLTDFRKVYDFAKDFDAVVISTAEHTHAFATLPALQLGKHVYCEKPLTHNVWEARVIREAAAKTKLATQMGTQIHASDNYRRVVELIQSGVIGDVTEAHVWVSRAWGWHTSEAEATAAKDIVFVQNRPAKPDPVPADMNFDLWLGPAPARDYNDVYFPGPKWYRWWDFGNGTMSDLGSHWIDLPFWALKLDHPLSIEASGPPVHPEIAPASMEVTYQYGKRGSMGPVQVSWYQGVNKPRIWKDNGIPPWPNGVLFVGSKGMVLSDYGKHVLLPEAKFADFQRPQPFIPQSLGHHAEWINACRTGAPTTCNFQYAGWLTEANHLGNVAYRAGKKLIWDAKHMRATNAPEIEPMIHRKYRKGWTLA